MIYFLEFVFFFGVGWWIGANLPKHNGCSGDCQQGRKECDC